MIQDQNSTPGKNCKTELPEDDAVTASNIVKYTIVRKDDGILTKCISLGEDEKLIKDSSKCTLSKGTFKTYEDTFQHFSEKLKQIRSNNMYDQALIHGVSEYEEANIVSKKHFNGQSNTITRSKEYFKYSTGPGIGMFDHDPADGQTSSDKEMLVNTIVDIFPEFAGTATVYTPSTSACIYTTDGKELRSIGNAFHLYFEVINADDLPRFADVLFKRLWLGGYGYIFITKDGKMLPRTIFDKAVFSPERLDFIAGAVCGEGLEQRMPDPVFEEGKPLDTKLLLDLTPGEKIEYERLVDKAKKDEGQEADEIKTDYIKTRTIELIKQGLSPTRAKQTVASRIGGILIGNDCLIFDEYGQTTVSEVLNNLGKYNLATLADPVEPNYGGGFDKAIFYANFDNYNPQIYSHAHGGRTFQLKHDYESLNNHLSSINPNDTSAVNQLRENWKYSINSSQLSNSEQGLVLKNIKVITGMGIGDMRNDLNEVVTDATSGNRQEGKLTHHDMALGYIETLTEENPPGPVGVESFIYTYDGRKWEDNKLERVSFQIADKYNSEPRCARGADYKAISIHTYDAIEDTDFFMSQPPGIPVPYGFLRIDDDGNLHREPYRPDHRVRYILQDNPCPGVATIELLSEKAPLFTQFLNTSVREPDHSDVISERELLLQEIAGGVISGHMSKLHKCAYLKGLGRNGKGVYCNIIQTLIPKKSVGAVSPFMWGQPVFLAQLSGKSLNLVSELPGDKLIPAAAFKAISGGDIMTGKNLYKGPFEFVCHASHIFSGNHWVKTNDHSVGFYSRWVLVEFPFVIPPEKRVVDLAAKIVKYEFPYILRWAIEGAQRLVKNGQFSTGSEHKRMIKEWRSIVDTIRSYLEDSDHVEIGTDQKVEKQILYDKYRIWCTRNGYQSCGRNDFYSQVLEKKTGDVRITNITIDGVRMFKGCDVY